MLREAAHRARSVSVYFQTGPLQHVPPGACEGSPQVSVPSSTEMLQKSRCDPHLSHVLLLHVLLLPPIYARYLLPQLPIGAENSPGEFLFSVLQLTMKATFRQAESTSPSYLTQACNGGHDLIRDEGSRWLFCLCFPNICYVNRVLENYCLVQ